jgi:CDP-glucose 4,6-dehydratase
MIDRSAFWAGRSVLVTGAGGFVGSWLADALLGFGAGVTAIIRDRPTASNFKLLRLADRVNLVEGSIADQPLVERVLGEYQIDTCFHLAAQAIVGVANRAPASTFESNVKGTWSLLEACRLSGRVERIVVASSDKAYGDHGLLTYNEDMPLLGSNPYDASKTCTEVIARCYRLSLGLPLAIARCANIYGGGDLNYDRLVPGTIRSALRMERPVVRSDGRPIRDYLYIGDAVSAYLTLAESLYQEDVLGQAFNFGGDAPISVYDLTRWILQLCDAGHLEPDVRGRGPTTGEIEHQCMSIAKAERTLEWSPKTSLEVGLGDTIGWYREHLGQTVAAKVATA